MTEEIIIRYLNNQCTDQELMEVRRWIEESDENARLLFQMEQLVDEALLLRDNSNEREKVLRAIQERISSEQTEETAADEKTLVSCHKVQNRNHQNKKDNNLFRAKPNEDTNDEENLNFGSNNNCKVGKQAKWRFAAAAVIIALILACLFVSIHSGNQIMEVKASGQALEVNLPDGSKVFLKDGTILSYPEKFASDLRQVKLCGEGFFQVTSDAGRPFIVEGELLNVTVLGTEFSFDSPEQGNSTVTLLKGSIKVTTNNAKDKDGVMLLPGQKAEYDVNTKLILVSETNASLDEVSSNSIIPMTNANIDDIAHMIEKLYGVEVIINGMDRSKTYSGSTIYYKDVDSTLEQLANTLPIQWSHSGNKIIISSEPNPTSNQ